MGVEQLIRDCGWFSGIQNDIKNIFGSPKKGW